jgi:hypothetical protein
MECFTLFRLLLKKNRGKGFDYEKRQIVRCENQSHQTR